MKVVFYMIDGARAPVILNGVRSWSIKQDFYEVDFASTCGRKAYVRACDVAYVAEES